MCNEFVCLLVFFAIHNVKCINKESKGRKNIRQTSNLAFQFVGFKRTCWRLFQKRVVRTKLDICVFIEIDWEVYIRVVFFMKLYLNLRNGRTENHPLRYQIHRHDITELLLYVALNTINRTPYSSKTDIEVSFKTNSFYETNL
jgi:hypothetical protein